MRTVILLTLVVTLSACAGIEIDAARKLSDGGVAASAGLETAASDLRTGLLSAARHTEMKDTIGSKSAHTSKIPERLRHFGDAIKARQAMLSELAGLYRTFHEFAYYDAQAKFSEATKSIFSSANGVAASLKQSGFSPTVAGLAEHAAGAIAQAAQAHDLKEASIALRATLSGVRAVLEAEKDGWTSLAREQSLAKYQLIYVLMGLGYENPLAYVHSASGAQDLGVTLVEVPADEFAECGKPNSLERRGCRVRLAALNDLESRSAAAADAAARSVGKSIDSLKQLESAHVDFENDGPVTLEVLQRYLDEANKEAKFFADLMGKK